MPTNYPIKVTYTPGQPLASWSLDGKTDFTIQAQKGDTLSFTFASADGIGQTMLGGLLLSGPRRHSSHKSPFQHHQIAIGDGSSVKIENDGLWGFAIAFSATQDDTEAFYFLPDPELEVGSNQPGA
jgi:hypothetical protein